MPALPALEHISLNITSLRGQRVILDADLAALYGVETKRFNEAVKRNLSRFPADFMFQLTEDEHQSLRSQFATSNSSPWRQTLPSLRLHRARCHHGGIGAQQSEGH